MAGVSKSGSGPQADINVVPLIDVVLVLLIIFMVVTPMLQKGVDVKLPKATNVIEKDERTTNDLIVSVKADGTYWLEQTEVSEDELKTGIASVLRNEPYKPIQVKGDERVTYGDVRKIVIMAQQAGAKVVNIATEAKKAKKT
jgi:biopolymer transport protein ExbD